jgi:YceI-like protein
VEGEESDPTKALIEATLGAASINTGVTPRDNDLRGPNFLEVEKFPDITFKSKRIEEAGKPKFKVIGDLTMHGITREVTLDTTFTGEGKDPWGNRRVTFNAETQINRKDSGLTYNTVLETGEFWVRDEVKITLEVQVIPAQGPGGCRGLSLSGRFGNPARACRRVLFFCCLRPDHTVTVPTRWLFPTDWATRRSGFF